MTGDVLWGRAIHEEPAKAWAMYAAAVARGVPVRQRRRSDVLADLADRFEPIRQP